jgi:uncharacterized protein YndB with AHSA1/START domain
MTESVAVSRVVPTDPERTFRLFTEEVGAWYRIDESTVMDHEQTVTLRFEPRVGGRFMDVYDSSTGEGRELGRIQLWEPPHRIQFLDAHDCEVEVSFVAVPHGTRVTIEQRGLGGLPDDVAERVRQWGWHIITPWFAEYVTQRDEET